VVRSWYEAKKSKVTMIYRLAAHIDWRRSNGLGDDPEEWVRECQNGTNLTLIQHARAVEDWVNSEGLFRFIKDKGHFKDTVTYFTNVKREIIANTEI